MKILLTGSSGFLGPHVRAQLADHELVGLCRNPQHRDDVAGDLLAPASLAAAMGGVECVVHAAGGVSHDPADTALMAAVHIEGTTNVLQAARDAGVRRVVHISSSGTVAVSDRKVVLNEDSPEPLRLVKDWPYYRAKLLAEKQALAFDGPEVVVLNPTLLLGPGDLRLSSVDMVQRFLDGRVPLSPPGGVSFVDVRDVAVMVEAALTLGQPGQRYLLGALNLSFQELFERIARIAGCSPPMLPLPRSTSRALGWLPDGLRGFVADKFDIEPFELELSSHFWWLDSSKAKAELGFTPRDPTDTLADTVRDLQSREA